MLSYAVIGKSLPFSYQYPFSLSVLLNTEIYNTFFFFFLQSMKGKSKSSHDLLKDDPHLSSVPAVKRSICDF